MIKSKRIRKLIEKMREGNGVPYGGGYEAYVDTFFDSLDERHWDAEEACFKAGQEAALTELLRLCSEEEVREVESRKRQLINELRNLGVRFTLDRDYYSPSGYVDLHVSNWPSIRNFDIAPLHEKEPYDPR